MDFYFFQLQAIVNLLFKIYVMIPQIKFVWASQLFWILGLCFSLSCWRSRSMVTESESDHVIFFDNSFTLVPMIVTTTSNLKQVYLSVLEVPKCIEAWQRKASIDVQLQFYNPRQNYSSCRVLVIATFLVNSQFHTLFNYWLWIPLYS